VSYRFAPSHRGGSGTPLVAIHGFLDAWHRWELVLPALERRRDVLAPTLSGTPAGLRRRRAPRRRTATRSRPVARGRRAFATSCHSRPRTSSTASALPQLDVPEVAAGLILATTSR